MVVVLTGMGRDGREGVIAVHRAGGRVVAEDPATARHPSMPSAAIATGCVHHVLPLREIPALLVHLVSPPPPR